MNNTLADFRIYKKSLSEIVHQLIDLMLNLQLSKREAEINPSV